MWHGRAEPPAASEFEAVKFASPDMDNKQDRAAGTYRGVGAGTLFQPKGQIMPTTKACLIVPTQIFYMPAALQYGEGQTEAGGIDESESLYWNC